jgi:Family of unknown function (DUF6364)
MQTKLTLRLERQLLERAKAYAEAHGTSVSQLIAAYLAALRRPSSTASIDEAWKEDLSPITRQLVGLGRPDPGAPEVDEAAYREDLEAKHSRHLGDPHD